jgi:thymidylate synthase ThyX
MFSEDDRLVLNYFFTNLDKPIFAAKNFHPEVWALMQARYSRSTEGLRESFLKLLKEDPENYNQLVGYIKNNKSGAVMDHAINKAIQFMDKWVLGYGHSSVAEGATIGFALEGVSILATKVIEDNRIGSFIEKSTRYVSFANDSFFIPQNLKDSVHAREINEFISLLFQTYTSLHGPVLEYIKKISPLKDGQNEKAWERSCMARRFDAIRYILPTCTLTSLGWTLNARQLAYAISKLLSHPLEEMKDLGSKLKKEGSIILPSLLKYAEKNHFMIETEQAMQKHSINSPTPGSSVELVEADEDADIILVSSILYRYSNAKYSAIKQKVALMSIDQKEKIYHDFIGNRGQFDPLHREFEHVKVTFDILIDYGAFRDIQRHRICTQTNQLFTTKNSYDIPMDIKNSGKEVLDKYILIMEKAKELYEKVAKEDSYSAQYLIPLAFRKRVLFTMSLREAFYFIKLRSTPQGHISYRTIARAMYDLIKKKYPLVSRYFICDLSDDELGRLKQETQFEQKLSKNLF